MSRGVLHAADRLGHRRRTEPAGRHEGIMRYLQGGEEEGRGIEYLKIQQGDEEQGAHGASQYRPIPHIPRRLVAARVSQALSPVCAHVTSLWRRAAR